MYPNRLIPIANYVNKGQVAPTETHVIPSTETYPSVKLAYIPQGRVVNNSGIVVPSSISVKSVGGTVFSEVFDRQSLVAKTFFADPLQKTIYFSKEDAGLVVLIDYLTRGDIIDASIINTIQNDLRQLECIRVGQIQLVDGEGVVDFSASVPEPISNMYVIATTSYGTVPSYEVDVESKTVTFGGEDTEYVNYLIFLDLNVPTER